MDGTSRAMMAEAAEMFDIAARLAEDEAAKDAPNPVLLGSFMELASACRGLMLAVKKRARGPFG